MTFTLPISIEQRPRGEQARALRAMVARRGIEQASRPTEPRTCHTIAVAGGKGGVGRSVIALNLAITLAQRGNKVGLIDACPDCGNIELLSGLNGYWNLQHVVLGCRQLPEIISSGPGKVQIVSGGSCLTDPYASSQAPAQLIDQLAAWESTLDWLVVDASGGASKLTRPFAAAADDLLIVTTPEATAITEAYASLKALASSTDARLGLLVNQATSETQARRILDRVQDAAYSLLQVDLHRRGYIPRDEAVPASVNSRIPFAMQPATSTAAQALQTLVQRWTKRSRPQGESSYFRRMHEHQRTLRAASRLGLEPK